MRDSVREKIASLVSDVKLLNLPELNTATDWESILRNINDSDSLLDSAFAVLLHIVQEPDHGSVSNVLECMENVINESVEMKYTSTHNIVNILIQLIYIWDAKDLTMAKQHAKKILTFILEEICNSNESALFLRCNLYRYLDSTTPFVQPNEFAMMNQRNPVSGSTLLDYDNRGGRVIFLHLLKTSLSIVDQILRSEAASCINSFFGPDELDNKSLECVSSHSEPIQVYACSVAEHLWQIDAYESAAVLYEIAIRSTCEIRRLDTDELLDAYNVWGLCKIEMGKLDNAYSIFEKAIKIYLKAINEKKSVLIRLQKQAARIYANMAYIYGTYAVDAVDESQEEKSYLLHAKKLINNSLELDRDNADTLSSSATIHYMCKELDDALLQYSAYYNSSNRLLGKLSALGCCIEIRLELLCQSDIDNDCCQSSIVHDEIITTLLQNLREYKLLYLKVKDSHYIDNVEYYHEIEKAKTIIDNFDLGQFADGCNEVSMCLLQIYITAMKIKANLQYDLVVPKLETGHSKEAIKKKTAVLPIAYYTTIENVKFLLDKTDVISDEIPNENVSQSLDLWLDAKSNSTQPKNCLTMMHVCYMNDPTEGYTLLQALSDSISNTDERNFLFQDTTPSGFREKLLDEKFVFLKSFTSLIDQLNMWTMYASDRSNNSDSNGCCVCIAPESFHMMLNAPQKSNDNKQLARNLDDFHLYRIAYVQNGKLCDSDLKLNQHYNNLNKLIIRLNNLLLTYQSVIDSSTIWNGLIRSLSFIAFLFKDASYSAEKELRLIITRDKTNKQQIKMTNQIPPKLYITPPHQIYAETIILGPKLLSQDKWIPYLQYKLVDMWETWPETKYGSRIPKIRKSAINYQD